MSLSPAPWKWIPPEDSDDLPMALIAAAPELRRLLKALLPGYCFHHCASKGSHTDVCALARGLLIDLLSAELKGG